MSSGNVVEIGVRVKMDGREFGNQLQDLRAGLGGVAVANQAAAASAGALTSATAATAAANDELVQAFRQSNQALQTAMQAIIANTAAANDGIGALVAGATASRERADAANTQAAAERAAAAAANDNAAALRKAAADTQQYASMAAQLRSALDPMYSAQQRFNQQLDAAELLLEKGVITEREYASALAVARQQLQDHAKAVVGSGDALDQASGKSKQAAAGYINLGRQMQDVAVMAAMPGVNLGTIITTQGGQIADAVAQMGGRFSGLASFLAGPWGAALIVGTGLLVNFAEQMWKSSDAADKTKNAHETLADKLNLQKHSWEEVIAAMRDYNREAKKTAQSAYDVAEAQYKEAQAALNAALAWRIKLAATLAADRKAMQTPTGPNGQGQLGASISAGVMEGFAKDNDAKIAELREGVKTTAGAFAEQIGKVNSDPRYAIERRFQKAREEIKAAGGDLDVMAAKITKLDQQEQAQLDNLKKKRQPKDNSASVVKFGDDIAGQIAKIANQYSELPTAVEKANADLLALEEKRRDIKFRAEGKNGNLVDVAALTAQANAAEALIRNSLTKPFRDYVEAQADQASVNKLIVAGRQDEADALRVVLGLQKQMGPLTEDQADKVLKIVRANQLNAQVWRDQQALIQANVAAATNMRTALNETVADTLKGRGSFDKILSSLGNSYVNIMSQRIVESMFGNSLRAFEDEATRNFRAATETSGAAILRLAAAADLAAGRIKGGNAGTSSGLSGADPVAQLFDSVLGKKPSNDNLSRADLASADPLVEVLSSAFAKATTNGNGVPVTTGDEIVAVGRRPKAAQTASLVDVSGVGSSLLSLANTLMSRLGLGIPESLMKGLKPLFNKLETALPEAVQGGLFGGAASSLVNGDGVASSIGGTIGGAIGGQMGKKFLASGLDTISQGLGKLAGPLGGIVGGLLGGMLGGLFTPTKAGTTVITGANKQSTTASTQEVSAGLTNMGNSITSTLEAVASKFNTSVGDFAVSIGQYKDYYRVSASGSSHVGDKHYPDTAGSDILYDGTDQATATLIAIQNAIADGAIKGLSKAVQKALSSSSNIESAVNEALKVQEVELAIGGIGAQMEKSFREAEQTAAERVRIAQQYGFDLLAVDKVNADARVALQKQLLETQVGSLQQILDEMSSGALFEGSAVDQRTAILAKIETAKADVAAGKDGASDTLAKLLEQLNTVSKEAFGTTAQYQADRAMIADVARDAVSVANGQINAAAAMTSAQNQTNAALDENNDQNSEVIALLKDAYTQGAISNDLLSRIAANLGSANSSLAALAKTS